MTVIQSRAEELRCAIENLYFTRRYLFGVLAELEDLGRTGTKTFKNTERNLKTINANIKRLESELETEEARTFDQAEDPYYFA